MKSLIAAIQFLTVLPVPRSFSCGERELGRSVMFFPVVGLIIGAGMVVLDHGVSFLLPPLPASVVMVIALLVISGCLHMDGLSDTADGFLSSRPRERILEIMRDSHIGPMGVIAVVCVLVLKLAALASVPDLLRWKILLLMPLAGRCALVIEMALLSYVRPEGGLAAVFAKNRSRFDVGWALLVFAGVAYGVAGMIGLIMVGVSMLGVLIFSFWCQKKIGGFTGDTLGAACEITEIVPALVAASWGYGRWWS